MKITRVSVAITGEFAGIHCNLTDTDREFLITEQNGDSLVISLALVNRCLQIAKVEESLADGTYLSGDQS